MSEIEAVLSEEELVEVEKQYLPFPSFREWSKTRLDEEAWSVWDRRLELRRRASSAEEFEKAIRYTKGRLYCSSWSKTGRGERSSKLQRSYMKERRRRLRGRVLANALRGLRGVW